MYAKIEKPINDAVKYNGSGPNTISFCLAELKSESEKYHFLGH